MKKEKEIAKGNGRWKEEKMELRRNCKRKRDEKIVKKNGCEKN